MKEEIISLLKNWKLEVQRKIPIDDIYLFGSLIYSNGIMFNPANSDLDLIIKIPDELDTAIKRRNWIRELKIHKQEIEQKLLFLLKKTDASQQIVSIVPVTHFEIKYNIHKGENRNFFEVNEFQEIDESTSFKGSERFELMKHENEFIIQVLKSIQKTRNQYLHNSPNEDSTKLRWKGNDIIPKELAREAAKIASLNEKVFMNGDELNTSFGHDFLKNNLKLMREEQEYLNLYSWIDSRSGGRSNAIDKEVLSQDNHLLFYEILYDLSIREEEKIKKKVDIDISTDFKTFLQDTEMLSKAHSSKESINLEEIFIPPTFKIHESLSLNNKEINLNQLIKNILVNKKILITGENQSGKTSICKILFQEFYKEDFIPIFLTDRENKYFGSFKSKIEKAFEQQYQSNLTFSEIDKAKIILLIDDFHFAKNKDKILRVLNEYGTQVLITDDIFYLNLKNESIFEEYQYHRINQFKPSLRNKLIKKWVSLNESNWTTPNEVYQEIDHKTELVNSALGKIIGEGIMPSYPFFILSFISNYDAFNKPLDQNITSQGYFYQVLIYIYLRKQGVKNEDFETYLNFLTELSFFFFTKNKTIVDKIEFNKYVESYKGQFNLTVKIEELIKNLRNTNILTLDDLGNYSFSYSYIYYFFTAKYLAENISTEKKRVEKILVNLHKDENAYIAVFISHHDKNSWILDEIVLNAMTLFETNIPTKLDKTELSFFDKRMNEVVKPFLPDDSASVEKQRNHDLKIKDHIENVERKRNKTKQELLEDEFENDEFAIELRRSVKTVEVMGRIFKNHAGSLKTNQLEVIFKEGMNVHLRCLSFFINLIKNEESQNFMEKIISRELSRILQEKDSDEEKNKFLNDKKKIRKIGRNIFWNINFSIIYGFTNKIIHSLGSNKLSSVIENVCDEINSPATFIVKHGIFMWYNKSLQIDKIYDKIESSDFSETAKNIMNYKIVNHCQNHLLKHDELQKIALRSNIPRKRLLKRKLKP